MKKSRPVRRPRRSRSRFHRQLPGEMHVVSAHFDGELHSWLRETPVAPGEQPWLEHAVEIGIRYSRDVAVTCGNTEVDIASRTLDVAIVGRAAEALWAASPGAPHWRDLGADALASITDRPDFAPLKDNVAVTLVALTHFLANHGYITAREGVVIRSRIDEHLPEWMIAFGYERVTLSPDLAPS